METIYMFFLRALFFPLFAQQSTPSNTRNQDKANNTSNFYKIQKEMEDYWDSKSLNKSSVIDEDGEDGGAPGWSLYKRWEYYWEQRVNTKTGEFPKTNSVIEYEKYKARTKCIKAKLHITKAGLILEQILPRTDIME